MPGADPWTLPELLAASEHSVNARTVRFWIKEGLLPAPSGGRGVHARYGARHAARIAEIRRLQRLGLSLANIGLLLRAEPGGAAPDDAASAEPAGAEGATATIGAAGFWHRPPATEELVLALAPGVRLLVDRDRAHQLDDAAIDALRRAAGPLLALLTARAEASISTGRSDLAPSTSNPHRAPTSTSAVPALPTTPAIGSPAAPSKRPGDGDEPKGPPHAG